MNTFGDRLKEERERLGLSQTALGDVGGVKKLAQINYEKGERMPDAAYLAAIAAAGADVLYILTGQRAFVPPPPLKPDEAALLDDYRHSPPEGKAAIRTTSAALAKPSSSKPGKKSA